MWYRCSTDEQFILIPFTLDEVDGFRVTRYYVENCVLVQDPEYQFYTTQEVAELAICSGDYEQGLLDYADAI